MLFGVCSTANSQIPVEMFGGHERSTVDIMFLKYFKNKQVENSDWLFFNRNRASIDYRMTKTAFLPQFGFTEAISYNHEKLKGFAPVIVEQIFSSGFFQKAGIQYASITKNMTVFTWLVSETLKMPDIDFFLLFRYTPKIKDKASLFTQVESINTFPTAGADKRIFYQRLRLGIQLKSYQFGVGADLSQTGNNNYTKTNNIGGFIRHEF